MLLPFSDSDSLKDVETSHNSDKMLGKHSRNEYNMLVFNNNRREGKEKRIVFITKVNKLL